MALGALHTALIGIATTLLAWQLGSQTGVHALIALLALGVAAVAVVGARRGHIAHLELCMLEASALATASAALGAWTLHLVFKPAALIFALLFIAASAYSASPRSTFCSKSWRLLALAVLASLAGDIFLMLPDLFIPGLVSFLIAHLAYIALLQRACAGLPTPQRC